MKEQLEFDNPKTMDEVIRKARICYQQNKPKGDMSKNWTEKESKFVPNDKGNKDARSKGLYKGQDNRNMNRNQPRFKVPSENKMNEKYGITEAELTIRPPVQCWGCRGPHYVKKFPLHKGPDEISQIQEESTMGKVARSIPKINVSLEDHQTEFQPTMVEFEGTVFDQTISILIDPRATLSYISPNILEQCKFQAVKFKNTWLVQLTLVDKRRVLAEVSKFPLKLANQPIMVDLNVLPLGSYDVLMGMDWLEKHLSLVNYKTKTINHQDEKGETQEIQGIQKPL